MKTTHSEPDRKPTVFPGITDGPTYINAACKHTDMNVYIHMLFSRQNHLFPRKKMVFLPKTIFFLGPREIIKPSFWSLAA